MMITEIKSVPHRARQQGLALVVMMFILALSITSILLSVVNANTLKIEQQEITILRLAQAKDAIIARAVMDDNRPGSLPCPDTNGDGSAELFSGNACPSYIGLLPWKTLGIANLIDETGQTLWYVLSPSFRDHTVAEPINSNTSGSITLDGLSTQVMALIISPGQALSGQSRSSSISIPADVSNYLELDNADLNDSFVSTGSNQTFNDKVISIVAQDVFPLVERKVLATVKNNLESYYVDNWQKFPFAALFIQGGYQGEGDRLHGSLPVQTPVIWSSVSEAVSSGLASINCNSALPITQSAVDIDCTITHIGPTNFQIVLVMDTLGMGFFSRISLSDVVDDGPASLNFISVDQILQEDGKGRVELNGEKTGLFGSSNFTVTVTQPRPPDWDTSLSWIWRNNWQELIYYSASSPYAPGVSALCDSNCHTINQITAVGVSIQPDIPAILMTAGTTLNVTELLAAPAYEEENPAQSRPSLDLEDYFDSANNTNSENLIYDQRLRVSKTFNDQVIEVLVP